MNGEPIIFTRVMKVGTSLATVIPAEIRRALNVQRGDYLMFGVHKDGTFACRLVTPEEQRNLKPKRITF